MPDRDLVLDVSTSGARPEVLAGVDEAGRGQFAVVIPSSCFGEPSDAPRRIVFVVDRSGSMRGRPIAQAKAALAACLGALSPADELGLVAFSQGFDSLSDCLQKADDEGRSAAERYIERIEAGGGTELLPAIEAAVGLLGGGGDLLLLTDGQVYGTDELLSGARAVGARVHCLGIGSASQDRLLALLARETGGVSRFVTPRERVDMAALALFASVGRPVATQVTYELSPSGARLAPEPPGHVLGGFPVIVWGETARAGDGRLKIGWESRQGHRELELVVPLAVNGLGATIVLLRGARLITDVDARAPSRTGDAAAKREQRRLTRLLEQLGREYGLASRAMALVAVVERAGDRPGVLPQTMVVPVGMAQDTPFSAYAGIPKGQGAISRSDIRLASAGPGAVAHAMLGRSSGPAQPEAFMGQPSFGMAIVPGSEADEPQPLVELAGRIRADGGLPGASEAERLARSALALLCFIAAGSAVDRGPFGPHVVRLVGYLRSAGPQGAGEGRSELLVQVLRIADNGGPLDRVDRSHAAWLAAGLRDAPAGFTAEAAWQRVADCL